MDKRKITMEIPLTRSPIGPRDVLPLAMLLTLRDREKDKDTRELIQEVIDKQTGGVDTLTVEVEIRGE